MTDEAAHVPTRTPAAPVLACLPALTMIMIYYWILPALRVNFPSLTPYERHLILEWDRTLIPQITLYAITIWAIIYQKQIRRTWIESFFWVINIVFAILLGIPLFLTLLGVDFMPRQM